MMNDNLLLSPVSLENSPIKQRTGFVHKVKKFLSFCGPGYMIAVGYMDPGNWATDIESGSKWGYSLLFIVLLSNVMAMILQHFCVRMGVMTQRDLAQNCKLYCPKWLNWFLYILAELAIISCDLAEVLGTAIALELLFGLPIIWGVLITVGDVLLLMAGIGGDEKSQRILEFAVIILMTIIGGCFCAEIFIFKPSWMEVFKGFLPLKPRIFTKPKVLLSALGILGATVMPHNLYLHSSIVKHRTAYDRRGNPDARSTINYATADGTFALFLALLINAAILIVSAAAFHSRGRTDVNSIEEASKLMKEWMGPVSSILFGLALLAAGQSSTVTGTLAGQIVFEGFLNLKMKPWLRRFVTRVVAIAPALLIVLVAGADSANDLLIYSQVVLSFQLPFAIIPLVIFTFREPPAGVDESCFRYWAARKDLWTERLLKVVGWVIGVVIIALNVLFTYSMIFGQ